MPQQWHKFEDDAAISITMVFADSDKKDIFFRDHALILANPPSSLTPIDLYQVNRESAYNCEWRAARLCNSVVVTQTKPVFRRLFIQNRHYSSPIVIYSPRPLMHPGAVWAAVSTGPQDYLLELSIKIKAQYSKPTRQYCVESAERCKLLPWMWLALNVRYPFAYSLGNVDPC